MDKAEGGQFDDAFSERKDGQAFFLSLIFASFQPTDRVRRKESNVTVKDGGRLLSWSCQAFHIYTKKREPERSFVQNKRNLTFFLGLGWK